MGTTFLHTSCPNHNFASRFCIQTSESVSSCREIYQKRCSNVSSGGAERLVVDAALGLQMLGHSVDIYTSHHDHNHCFEETRDGEQLKVTKSSAFMVSFRNPSCPLCKAAIPPITPGEIAYPLRSCSATTPHSQTVV